MGGLQDCGSWLQISRDCTEHCKSHKHGDLISSSICNDKEEEAILFMALLCGNFWNAVDSKGRTPLHVAASLGKDTVLTWLLQFKNISKEVRDLESGYTALHRSIYYGQIGIAKDLLQNNVNVDIVDNDGLDYLDHVVKDRPSYIEYDRNNPNELYTWGSNVNYNLGIESHQPKALPELASTPSLKYWKQIALGKYHSLFLSSSNEVFSCGHGQGGRLGLGMEQSQLSLQKIKLPMSCEFVCVGRDHSVLLLENGTALTFGLNQYGQLGHASPCDKILSPKVIHSKHVMHQKIKGIAAGKYYTILYNEEYVFTFGLNLGQLGHLACEKSILMPKRVTSLISDKFRVSSICCSDDAVVVMTSTPTGNSNVLLLHNFKCRKITSRPDIVKVQVLSLTSKSPCKDDIKDNFLIVFLLKCGSLLLWEGASQKLIKAKMNIKHEVHISDFTLNSQYLTILSSEGMGYTTTLPKVFKCNNEVHQYYKKSGVNQVENELTHKLPMRKIPNVYRGVAVYSDPVGENYAILQNDPKTWLFELPNLKECTIYTDMRSLYQEANALQSWDCQFHVDCQTFYAHKFIIASRCPSFYIKYIKTSQDLPVVLDNTNAFLFENILQLIYSNECDILRHGELIKCSMDAAEVCQTKPVRKNKSNKNKSKKKSLSGLSENTVVKSMHRIASHLGCDVVARYLEGCVVNEDDHILITESRMKDSLTFSYNDSTFSDVTLTSEDDKDFKVHKCVLTGRSEYFKSMFSFGWNEVCRGFQKPLKLQFKADVLSVILEFLYSDDVSPVLNTSTVPFLCDILIASDQLLLERLKSACEVALSQLLTIKNVADILELACFVNAVDLQQTCCQLITFNMAALLDSRLLENCSSSTLRLLSKTYQAAVQNERRRICTSDHLLGPDYIRDMLGQVDMDILDALVKEINLVTNDKVGERTKPKVKRHRNRKSSTRLSESFEDETVHSNTSPIFSVIQNSPEVKTETLHSAGLVLSCPRPITQNDLNIRYPDIDNTPFNFTVFNHSTQGSEFPELGTQIPKASHKNSENSMQVNKTFRKTKKKAKVSVKSPSNNDGVVAGPAWGVNIGNDVVVNSLADIILSELNSSQTDRPDARPHDFETKHPWGKSIIQSQYPKSYLGAQHCFTQILQEEEEEYQNLVTVTNKSLHLIQIEDQAIEELLAFYQELVTGEEFLSVSRVNSGCVGTPLWRNETAYQK